ncbi:putative acetoin(diacetyl) reductase [Gordonia amarae NBRC 15530]|uniref:diacetyl reductase [(S)-acetoin forming] n=2 Tax=Gordonia amarae TaxID=36821 RepID=G7GUY6_9ACTN|nr:putative acetoin(diacetyl) reductase [Gordonia amarae NBRC 15530]
MDDVKERGDDMSTTGRPIEGKVALVTGAGRGIGRGIALRLARDGADLCLVDLSLDAVAGVSQEVVELGVKATTFAADVSDRDQVFAAVDHAASALGGFDIMVNNAGIALVESVADSTPEQVNKLWAINVNGTLWGIQAAAAKLIELGHGGKIINASSIAGHDGFPMLGVYSASKFAVRALTQAAARELADRQITVNAYCPGVVGTDMWVEIDKRFAALTGAAEGETYDKFVSGIALGRAETPDDVAGFVSYLAGPDSDYMTGQAGLIDGGILFR